MVLLIVIGGLRPEALKPERCPTLTGLMARGTSTLEACSVAPSATLPCHMSLFHSVPPERHGVTTNIWTPMARPLPGLLEVAHAAGRRCGLFYNWEPLRNVGQPGSLAASVFRDNRETPNGDHTMAAEAARLLSTEPLDFAFIYLGTVDAAGHAVGWMSDGYLEQASAVDALVGRLLDEVPPDAHVLVQSDHGGYARGNDADLPEDMTIPWLLAGPQIRTGHVLKTEVSLLDTAPTLARLLGVEPHAAWEGRCVDEAFSAF